MISSIKIVNKYHTPRRQIPFFFVLFSFPLFSSVVPINSDMRLALAAFMIFSKTQAMWRSIWIKPSFVLHQTEETICTKDLHHTDRPLPRPASPSGWCHDGTPEAEIRLLTV